MEINVHKSINKTAYIFWECKYSYSCLFCDFITGQKENVQYSCLLAQT